MGNRGNKGEQRIRRGRNSNKGEQRVTGVTRIEKG